MTRNLPSPLTSRSLTTTAPLQLYLQEIAKYPLLSPEEEYETALLHHEHGDIAAAHRLVTSNLRLVVKIANEFRHAQTNLLDLIQEGNYGLMQAVKKYNPYKGVKLSSYAAWWIRAYILKHIMDNKSQVKIGTTAAQRKLFFKLRKETEKLLKEYETVDSRLLAERLDVREKDVLEMQMRMAAPDLSLDAPVNHGGRDEESNFRGLTLSSDEPSVEDNLVKNEIQERFGESLKEFRETLKGRDLEIFELRLMAENPLTLQQIGEKYGITRERARQIEARIINKLKEFVEHQGIIDINAE